ncbi:Similar to S.cerevisiae protein YPD1 (Osmotic stress-responsive phosphorelay intermediate sensor protein) [Malassezia sympodialis ATCC 42132]|uniref:Similar to S.cerevisiae protein YPD1 (Osmotic stress-responsive phosphorelay intermediate sensor protein) n=1 Tax=Malassezia sympodialis (strain ATCC 42132) TaxID=1230383 RepID=A0A1M8A4Z0_MALS4|nr:Similar to S.cerevisiae protein YPD1 (Osmotic stress-responsive phosphorelay intermediate sensor protein) [Malassezia sympodialis ATCC 42132]
MSEPGQGAPSLPEDVIDIEVFEQLLEMDEDDREFSRSLVWNYFEQAENTFDKMDAALAREALSELSTLGHFLKGSSAAVGVIKVRNSCEAIQHYGNCHEADGATSLPNDVALDRLRGAVATVKKEYEEAERALRAFYGDA